METNNMTNEEMLVEFLLGQEGFGIPVKNVNEIIIPTPVTPIPRSHPFIEGITDIRGEVLPVIDLAAALSIANKQANDEARFIVCEFEEKRVIFHVSKVEQIITVNQIETPNEIGKAQDFVTGVVRVGNRIVLLLDFRKLLSEISGELK